jgi:DNA-binding NarL/FixJ family response regulator
MVPIRVMVVDDAADARFLIMLVLGDAEGIEVVAEADGAERALALLDDCVVDVALVDARMPAVDGYELTRLILERRSEVRVALLTSVVDSVIEAAALEAGAVAAWSKGELDHLAEQIRALVA